MAAEGIKFSHLIRIIFGSGLTLLIKLLNLQSTLYLYSALVPARRNSITATNANASTMCKSFRSAPTFAHRSADWQNSLRKASFQRKLRQSALRYQQA